METEPKLDLILKIRALAGQVGGLDNDLQDACDADNYDFQVQVGLAESIVEILDYDPSKTVQWFGYCLVQFGLGSNDRANALLDALEREVEALLYDADDADDDSSAGDPAP